MSSTPCSARRGPPTAARASSGWIRLKAPATPAAWRSPDASPATNRTLRMMVCVPDEGRQSQFDLLHNAERDTKGQSAFFTGDDDRRLAGERRDKTFLFEFQRLAIRGVQLFALDIGRNIRRTRLHRFRVEVSAQLVELAGTSGQIEREIFAFLKDANLSLLLSGDTARCDVGDRARGECHPRVGDVEHWSQHRHPHRGDLARVRSDECQQQIDVVDHQIEHHGDVRAAEAERRQSLAVDEPRTLDVWKRRPHRAVESFDVSDLHDDPALLRQIEQGIRFLKRRRNRLLDEDVPTSVDRRAGNRKMLRCRYHDDHCIRCVEQRIKCLVRADFELFLDFATAVRIALDEAAQLCAAQVAEDSYVVKAETARAYHSNARKLGQITTPRSLASTNRTSSRTSGSAS